VAGSAIRCAVPLNLCTARRYIFVGPQHIDRSVQVVLRTRMYIDIILSSSLATTKMRANITSDVDQNSGDVGRSSSSSSTNENEATAVSVLNHRLASLTKLYGREVEQDQLRSVYERVVHHDHQQLSSSTSNSSNYNNKTEFVVIHGTTGSGKSALAETFKSPSSHSHYYISGKFDQLSQLQEPHAAFLEAFDMFVSNYLMSDTSVPNERRNSLKDSLAKEMYLFKEVIPSLDEFFTHEGDNSNENSTSVGTTETCDEHHNTRKNVQKFIPSTSNKAGRLKYAFRVFLRTVTSPEHPLVFVLDDLHWADESALDLLGSLLCDTSNRNTLFVATHRDDADLRKLTTMMTQLRPSAVSVTNISVGGMEEASVACMIWDILQPRNSNASTLLSHWIFQQTKGNAFFVLELLRGVVFDGSLRYETDTATGANWWTWDMEDIEMKVNRSMNDLVLDTISRLPEEVQEALKLASCLGAKVNRYILCSLVGNDALVDACLELGASHGLLIEDRGRLTFAHDAIQEALVSLVPVDDRDASHYRIGRKLWRRFDMTELDDKIFIVAGQLLVGSKHIVDVRERVAVAKLCLRAGERAIQMSSFQSAFMYLMKSIELLNEAACWREEYLLCLSIYSTAAEVSYCIGEFENVHKIVSTITSQARTFDDTLRGHASSIFALGSSDQLDEAIAYGMNILSDLGITFPKKVKLFRTYMKVHRLRRRLRRTSAEQILRVPVMVDSRKLAAMHIMCLLFMYAFMHKEDLVPLISVRMIELSLEYGLCATSCIGFVTFGAFLCGYVLFVVVIFAAILELNNIYIYIFCSPLNDIEEGYRIGKLAIEMHERFPVQVWFVRCTTIYVLGIQNFKKPILTCLGTLERAHRVGIRTGDIEFSMLSALTHAFMQFEFMPLSYLAATYEGIREQALVYGQSVTEIMCRPFLQTIYNIMGEGNSDPQELCGRVLDAATLEMLRLSNGKRYIFCHFHAMMLAYLFGNYEKAAKYSKVLRPLSDQPFGALDAALIVLFDGLVSIQFSRIPNHRRSRRRHAQEQVKRMKHWAEYAPETFLCRQFLLQAELSSLDGKHSSVHAKYVGAIALAKDAGSLFQSALTNEHAGKYYLFIRKDRETATPFLREALVYYNRWGARAKAEHLAREVKICDS
jgi:predicted ATPase